MTDRRFINQQNLNDKGLLLSVDCRFCRLVQKYDKYAHVAPCGCAGATRYVHRECLQRWMVVKFEHVYNHAHNGDPREFNIFCEVCQQRMEVSFTIVHKLSKYEDFVEKIIAHKILFAALLLLGTGALVAIIVLLIFGSGSDNGFPPKLIFGLAVSGAALVVVIIIFICYFMVLKSIEVEHIANNKNPMIMGLQANLDSVSEEDEEGEEKDPYFGVEPSKKEEIDKSLMLESKRDSGSAVSKTLTDLVMMKMYKHDEPSLKGKSDKDFNASRFDRFSRFSKPTVKEREMRDQQVQIQMPRHDKSIQQSISLKNQSIQPSQNVKDAAVQPSLLPTRTRRIFREDPSVLPQSSVADRPINDQKAVPPKKIEKVFISEYQENVQPPTSYRKPTLVEPELPSSGDSKKSQEQMVKQPPSKTFKEASGDAKLKLRTIRDPIKIRVMF